ncbi:Cyclic nucleotide-binding protein [Syntrophobacter sp. SbD1]|nr:Cyclic nucleotide-binding protein [Syntrophobacter sp. SbD1]
MEFENLRILLKNSALRDLPPEELDELARTVKSRVAGPDEVIFKEGDPPDAFYIISSGRVRIFVRHEDRIEREFRVFGPGEHFGQLALLTGETRTSSAMSVDESRLIVITREQFDRLLHDHPDLSRNFVREVRRWLLRDQKIIKQGAGAIIRASRVAWYDFVLVLAISVVLAITFNISNPNGIHFVPVRPDPAPSISAVAAMEDYRQGQTLIVDAMPGNFYQQRHIKGAVNMTMALFDFIYLMSFSEVDKDKEIVVYGNTISRPYDLEIADKLQLRGYRNVKVLDGGLQAWEANGYPVEKEASE